jgi:hypothetical protein
MYLCFRVVLVASPYAVFRAEPLAWSAPPSPPPSPACRNQSQSSGWPCLIQGELFDASRPTGTQRPSRAAHS